MVHTKFSYLTTAELLAAVDNPIAAEDMPAMIAELASRLNTFFPTQKGST